VEDNNNATFRDGFAGDKRYLKGFLIKRDLIFMINPNRFPTDETKIIYIISRLFGDAMNWAASLMENDDPCLQNYQAFVAKLKSVFGTYNSTFIANQKLRTIKQNRLGDIRSFILDFNRYSDESSWNEEAKIDAFLAGLHDQIATKILEMFPRPRSLSAMQTIAARIDSWILTNRQFFNTQGRSNNNHNNNNNNQNKKGWNSNKNPKFKPHGPLTKEEKERRRRENICLYCSFPDHSLDNCPVKNKYKHSTDTSHMTNSETSLKENFTRRPRISDLPNSKLPIFEFTFNILKTTTISKVLLNCSSQQILLTFTLLRKIIFLSTTKQIIQKKLV